VRWTVLLLEVANLHFARNTTVGDTALVHVDVEVPVESPSGSPRVLDDPVISSIVLVPSDDFDSMSSCLLGGGLLVDTGAV